MFGSVAQILKSLWLGLVWFSEWNSSPTKTISKYMLKNASLIKANQTCDARE